ncbi:MAG: ATP-binding cassette domain-containing protein, partial [Syntrophaceae bacterium]|nr:ATP-binding cassette domain-containing protein [Syntrophaceae bacterium]
MIGIDNVNIRLGEFDLKDINLRIERNEFFILMGPTGAGKTVLLEAIAGLIRVDTGRIAVGGKDVTA